MISLLSGATLMIFAVITAAFCALMAWGTNGLQVLETPEGVFIRYGLMSSLYSVVGGVALLVCAIRMVPGPVKQHRFDDEWRLFSRHSTFRLIVMLAGLAMLVGFAEQRFAFGEITKDGFRMSNTLATLNEPIQYKYSEFSQIRLDEKKGRRRDGFGTTERYMVLTLKDGSVEEIRLNQIQLKTIMLLKEKMEAEVLKQPQAGEAAVTEPAVLQATP